MSNVIKNQPFDEAIELSGSEDQSFNESGLVRVEHQRSGLGDDGLGDTRPPGGRPDSPLSGGGFSSDGDQDNSYANKLQGFISDLNEGDESPRGGLGGSGLDREMGGGLDREMGGISGDSFGQTGDSFDHRDGPADSTHSHDSFDDSHNPLPVGAYNAEDYADLNVTQEVRDLFDKITHYKPLDIELPTNVDPFVPEFIPAVGDLDAFIIVPRPDGRTDDTGVKVLREANPTQTDATVLKHRLRATTKQSNLKAVPVKAVSNVDRSPNQVQHWIESIKEIHDDRPPATVHYTNQMPNIEALMQVWPAEFEELLDTAKLPPADIDVDLIEYCKMVCAILDIPVHDNVMESLHVLFTLFSEFRSNQFFMGGGAQPSFNADNAVSNQYIPNQGGARPF